MLTPDYKTRLVEAAKNKKTDRPPCICPGGMMNMIVYEIMEKAGVYWPDAHYNPNDMAKLTKALRENGGFENYGVPFCMTVEAEAMGAKVDMGSDLEEPHVVVSPLEDVIDISVLKNIDISKGRINTVIESIKVLKSLDTDVPIVANLTGPVSVAGTLLDMTTLLMSFRKHPEDSAKMLDFITDNLIVYAQAMVEAGADVICISEPSGTGEILGKVHFENFTLPYVNKILDALDVSVKIVHICGRLHNIYEALSKINCDVFSFDALVDIESIKPYLEDKALMGNVSTHALGVMPSDKIISLTQNVIDKGIDIVAPACGLPTTTPLENINAMVNTATGAYKIIQYSDIIERNKL